ncbi:MAG: flagellar motor switch protein FliM [Oscillospiraceae bacterium]|nr:flagellar motor switch protein FliM [Oscillospiraceae bacterium]
MPDILSQAEIDELLNSLTAAPGPEEEKKKEEPTEGETVKSYDFRTANRFTKDQMRSLGVVFDTYGQLFATRVTSILRAPCECEILSVEEMRYSEFNNSLPSPVILGVFGAQPLTGAQLIQVSPEMAYMLINRLLGGMKPSKESGKQFTEVELALIDRFLRMVMRTFDEAWEKVLTVTSQLERLETNMQFVQITGLNDAVVVGMMNLKAGDDEGLLSICLPRAGIEKIAGQLNTRMIYSTSVAGHEKDEKQTQILGDRVGKSAVPVTAYFRETPATVADIMELNVGDVIRLRHMVTEPLMVNVAHIAKFRAKIGSAGKRYAVKITEIIREGESEDERFAV